MDLPLSSGTKLGRYEVRSKIGEGGMGEVYLARDTQLDRDIAIKILPAQIARDRQRLHRFLQEARAAAALSHPNIAHIYEIGEHEGGYFIAMEYIEGTPLDRKIGGRPLPVNETLDIGIQIADALDEAHAKGITHRDIKSSNIMITQRGRVKVLDFGLAKVAQTAATLNQISDSEIATRVKTSPGVVIGTINYMSPEQASGKEVDARTDIWSVGVVLYEMVTGRLPFEGATPSHVIVAILEKEPLPLSAHVPNVPEALDWIVTETLTKDATERTQTARELLKKLQRLKQRVDADAEVERSVAPDQFATARGAAPQANVSIHSAPTTIGGITPSTGEVAAAPTNLSSAEYVVNQIKSHKKAFVLTGIIALIVLIGIGFAVYRFVSRSRPNIISFEAAKLTRLTTSGKVSRAAIAPDGRYVVHVVEDAGQQSLWMRQTATAVSVQIVAPARVRYAGLTFSPDGNYLYFARQDEGATLTTLYQTAVLGGATRKVSDDVGGAITFSPDGRQFAFVRYNPAQGESSLIIANADGGGERRLATQKEPRTFNSNSPAWSPDGKWIACGGGQISPGKQPHSVLEVSVDDGAVRPLTPPLWGDIGQLAWLRDGSGLLFSGAGQASGYFYQIWYAARAGGEAQRVTNDLSNYYGASLTADSSALVTVQADFVSNVWVAPGGDAGRARQITSAKYDGYKGVVWTGDGRIVHATRTFDIWTTDADGGNAKPLTPDEHNNRYPSITPDNRYLVFESWRGGQNQIWRMDIDGANAKLLTSGETSKNHPQLSPDGKWVVYDSNAAGKVTLWRVAIEGGAETQLTQEFAIYPTVSPDARWIACVYQHDPKQPLKLAIIPAAGGQPVKEFDIPQDAAFNINVWQLRFSPDGRALDYLYDTGGVTNIWRQPADGGKAAQLTDFKSGLIFAFDWSRDGRQLLLARGTVTRDAVLISNAK